MPLAELDGRRVGFDEFGSGPALLLLNGLGADRSSSALAARRYADAGYHAITLDNAGAGESELPGGPLTIARLADAAAALLGHLGVERAHVFGPSMGGAIAQELALRHPHVVASLQLHCTWGRTDAYTAALYRSWQEIVRSAGPAAVWSHMLLWAMTPSFYEANPELVAGYLAAIPGSSADAFCAQAEACVAHDALDRVGAIRAPTLVTVGELDRVTRPEHAGELAGRIPQARLRVWPGVGHLPFVERAADFDALVLEFLAAAAGAPGSPAPT